MLTESGGSRTLIQQKIKGHSVEGFKILDVDRGITPIIPIDADNHINTVLAFDGDFSRYSFSEQAIRVKYDKTLAEYTPPEYFQKTGVVIRRIISRQQRIIAALNHEGYVFNKSYLIALCLAQEGYSTLYVIVVVASKLQLSLFICSYAFERRDDF